MCGPTRPVPSARSPGPACPVYWSGCERRCGHPARRPDRRGRGPGRRLPDSPPPLRDRSRRTADVDDLSATRRHTGGDHHMSRTTTESSEKKTVTTYDYEKDGAAIYRQSFATIRAEADLAGLPADVSQVAVRMIHACGMVDLVRDLVYTPDVVARRPRGAAGRRARPVRRRRWSPAVSPASGCPPATTWCARSPTRPCPSSRRSSAPRAAPPRWSCGATGWRAPWSPSATRPPRSSGCWR